MEEELEERIRHEIRELEDSIAASERQIAHHGQLGIINPFSMFGKLAAVLIVALILVGGGIYIGKSMNKPNQVAVNLTVSPTVSQSAQTLPTTNPASDQAAKLDKSTTAGGVKSTIFKTYEVDYPSSWAPTHETTNVTDKLTLIKGNYSISIYQAPSEAGPCSYPDNVQNGPFSSTYSKYKEIQGSQYKLRMSWDEEGPTIMYKVCASQDGKAFGDPPLFGYTTVKAPNPADPATMSEIYQILTSLTTK